MGRDDLRGFEEAFEGFVAGDGILFCDLLGPVVAEAVDFHAEGVSSFCDFLADTAEADEADVFAEDFVAGEACPVAGFGGVYGRDEVFGDGEEEEHGVLGDGFVVDSGCEEDGDFHFPGGLEVDFIESDAVFGDYFEVGSAFFEDFAGDGVVAAEEGIEVVFSEFEHTGLGEGSSFPDDFPVLRVHEFVMRTGCVLVAAGCEENFHRWYGTGWTVRGSLDVKGKVFNGEGMVRV